MPDKAKRRITVLIVVAVLSGCETLAPSTQATITPITVNTLSAFHSPVPTLSTYPPTSTPVPGPTSTVVPTSSGTLTFTPTVLPTLVNPPARNPEIEFPSNLILDEWLLAENSDLTRFSFTPIQGTKEQIIERYESLYSYDVFPSPLIQGHYGKVLLNGHELMVKDETVDSKSLIHVFYDGKEISRVESGYVYIRPNVWGVWAYQNHWIMEYVNYFKNPYGSFYTIGNIIWDGESLNSIFNYQESFGLTAIDGRLLYFFKRNDRIGISYDGKEYNLDYESVPHYHCCEIGFYTNPDGIGTGWQLNQNLSFFTERNGSKYFVVIRTK